MASNAGSQDHLWEGCKGLADLAARGGDGLEAVRRQGGTQVRLSMRSVELTLLKHPLSLEDRTKTIVSRSTRDRVVVPARRGAPIS